MTNADATHRRRTTIPTSVVRANGHEPRIGASDLLTPAAVAEAELGQAPAGRPSPRYPLWRERLTPVAAVGAGGFLGANARYLAGLWVTHHWESAFPLGTLLINVTGSFVLGFYLTGPAKPTRGRSTSRLFVATGFLGAYTTFSTFSYEAVRLVQHGQPISALAYVSASLIVGLAAAVAGLTAAHALRGPAAREYSP
jgi:CrcB protein